MISQFLPGNVIVPEIVPEGLNVNPGGRLKAVEKTYGPVPPLAVRVVLYGIFSVAFGRTPAVVMLTA
jgi:hypothetical protein